MKVVLVKAEDWQGLFIEGKLINEGHNLTIKDLAQDCKTHNVRLEDVEEKRVTDNYYKNYLSEYGSFPDNLSEVELIKN